MSHHFPLFPVGQLMRAPVCDASVEATGIPCPAEAHVFTLYDVMRTVFLPSLAWTFWPLQFVGICISVETPTSPSVDF
jgi:hypothetical protein